MARWLSGALGGFFTGAAAGAAIALATTAINSSVRTGSDGLVFGIELAIAYGLVGAILGTCASLVLGARAGESRWAGAGLAALAVLCGALAFVLADRVVGPRISSGETSLTRAAVALGCAFAAALATALAARRAHVRAPLSRAAPVVLAGAALVLIGLLARLALPGRAAEPPPSALPGVNRDVRVLLLGIDGMDWRRIDPLLAEGRLPNFARLISGGLRADLKTLRPTWSPIVWATIATGVPEALHGVHDFTEMSIPGLERGLQRSYTKLEEPALLPSHTGLVPLLRGLLRAGVLNQYPISSKHRRAKALWNILSDRGVLVAVASWFASFPAETVNGWIVSDNDPWRQWFNQHKYAQSGPAESSASGITYPPELLSELIAALPHLPEDERLEAHQEMRALIYSDMPEAERAHMRGRPGLQPMAASVIGSDRWATEAGLFVWREKRPQFLAVYLRGIDNLSHRLREYTGVIDRTYEWTDRLLGAFLDALDERTVLLVVSDHGWAYEPEVPAGHMHSPDGVLVLYGAGVDPHARFVDPPSVLDVAPTVLALFGLPPSRDMPGRAWREAFGERGRGFATEKISGWGAFEPVFPFAGSEGGEAREAGVQRLRELGYAE